jgi:lysophospholipase L1-like esterase
MARLILPGVSRINPANDVLQRNDLLKWRGALGANRRKKVAIIGDSVSRGQSTGAGTAQGPNAWPIQLAAQLQASGINAGANNVWGDGGSWGLGQSMTNFAGGDSRIAFTGAWALGSTKTAGGNAFAPTAAGSMTFTPTGNVTKFDIYWRDAAVGRNFSWAIDGGAATTISSSGATQIVKTTVSAGTLGAHSITLAWVAGTPTVMAIDGYDDTAGRNEIAIQNWGICGATTTSLLDNSDTVTGRLAMYNFYQPDLTILCPIINNWRTSISQATTYTELTALVTQAQLTGSAAIITPPYDSGVAGLTAQQDQYAAIAATVASEKNAHLVDYRSTLGSYALANSAGFYSDSIHLTQAGYSDVARLVKALVF